MSTKKNCHVVESNYILTKIVIKSFVSVFQSFITEKIFMNWPSEISIERGQIEGDQLEQ